MRTATITRETLETTVTIRLNLDAPLHPSEDEGIDTGHGFLDHMLEQLKRHARMGLSVQARGDLHVDVHHLVEDVGITFGQAFTEALGDKRGLERYADATVPMDECLVQIAMDISGRPHLEFRPEELGITGDVNGYTIYHLREFLRGFCNHANVTLHVRLLNGREPHHVIEAAHKALARAMRAAVSVTGDTLPSTKGSL